MKDVFKKYFVPNEANGYQPHILQKTAVVLMSILVLLTFTLANLHALLWVNSNWLIGTILPAVVVELTNENRDTGHLGTLKRSTVLDEAAALKAQHMAENSYFSHYAPDGTSPWYFFDSVSYNYIHAGENLAVHFSDSDEVVEAWMESPTHRENIMNGKYTEIGVGTARGTYQGYPTVFVVQLFGTPVAPVAVAEPEVAAPTPEPAALAVADPVPEVVSVSEPEVAVEAPALTPEPIEGPVIEVVETEPAVVPIEVLNENANAIAVSDVAETSREVGEVSEVAGIDFEQPSYGEGSNPVSSIARIATQPQRLLNIVYAFTSLFVFGALLASILIEIRRQHPVQIAYGTGLLAAMVALMYIHVVITSGALIV